jgi:excisionase family DNA binding protein
MMLTVKQAAEATGKSKPTILRAIQSHKISATRDDITGAWTIDAAELHRVYPPASAQQVRTEPMTQDASNDDAVMLRRELVLMTTERERERAQLQERIDDLTRRLNDEAEERRKLTAILTDQRQQAEQSPRRLWWRRGKG